jgi:hypothetical protein
LINRNWFRNLSTVALLKGSMLSTASGEANDVVSGRSYDRQRAVSCPPAGSYVAVSGQSPVAADI